MFRKDNNKRLLNQKIGIYNAYIILLAKKNAILKQQRINNIKRFTHLQYINNNSQLFIPESQINNPSIEEPILHPVIEEPYNCTSEIKSYDLEETTETSIEQSKENHLELKETNQNKISLTTGFLSRLIRK
jgi:hypothetical protein